MTRKERISEDEIQILLNHLGHKLEISFPLYEFNLIEARTNDKGYTIQQAANRALFDDNLNDDQECQHEMPNYNDFLLCMLHSGILHYTNEEQFAKRADNYSQMKKGAYFGLDTNLFYHGFPTNSGIDPNNFIIVDTTRSEIEASINFKYSGQQIRDLKRHVRFQKHLLDELVNGKTKKSRLAYYLALREFRKIRDRALIIPAIEESTNDKEANDLIIVKTLRQFEEEKYSLPIMLTADENLAALCDSQGLEHFLFEFPSTTDEKRCTPNGMVKLIFHLATVFGFIQVNSANIFGEFRGKGGNIDELKIEFLDERIYDKFSKDLKICRRLMNLNIAQQMP